MFREFHVSAPVQLEGCQTWLRGFCLRLGCGVSISDLVGGCISDLVASVYLRLGCGVYISDLVAGVYILGLVAVFISHIWLRGLYLKLGSGFYVSGRLHLKVIRLGCELYITYLVAGSMSRVVLHLKVIRLGCELYITYLVAGSMSRVVLRLKVNRLSCELYITYLVAGSMSREGYQTKM